MLRQAVQGIADIITTPGLINRDFSDIRAIMLGMGFAMMGSASARGEHALVQAAEQAINSALLEEGGVRGARGILINITGSSKLSLHEVNEACSLIRTAAENDDVQINFGIVLDEALDDEVKITVLATGFQRAGMPALRPSHTSDQVLERATDPRHFSAVSETPIPTSRFDESDERNTRTGGRGRAGRRSGGGVCGREFFKRIGGERNTRGR